MSNHPLKAFLAQRIANGLVRKSVNRRSTWAERYRIMGKPFPGPWTFDHHPWLREIHDAQEELVVGMKAAQMGYTETALNIALAEIDINGQSVLYLLPSTKPDAIDFSTSRFDPALEMSEHLSRLFSDVKNIGHKRAGTANLWFRGTRKKNLVKGLPAGILIFDEYDEMTMENVAQAFERATGQIQRQAFLLSTPTIEGFGIDAQFQLSSQDHFFFKCPHCSRKITFEYPDCLVITAEEVTDPRIRDSHLICTLCKHKLEHADKQYFLKDGIWVPTYSDRPIRGFQIPQFFSMTLEPWNIAEKALRAQFSPADEQELYNSKLGQTFTPKGSKITDQDLTDCTRGYHQLESSNLPQNELIVMGIDVGKWIHYEITSHKIDGKVETLDVNLLSRAKVIKAGKVKDFEELDTLFTSYRVAVAVIDANPEHRKALEFAQRFWGRVFLCYYGSSTTGKQITIHSEDEHTITVDRTSWMDLALSRFKAGNDRIVIPTDIGLEYREHLKAVVRVYQKDATGNPVAKYLNSKEDHHAHSRTYCEIALRLAGRIISSQDLGNIL